MDEDAFKSCLPMPEDKLGRQESEAVALDADGLSFSQGGSGASHEDAQILQGS